MLAFTLMVSMLILLWWNHRLLSENHKLRESIRLLRTEVARRDAAIIAEMAAKMQKVRL